jgi:hypothetical protein
MNPAALVRDLTARGVRFAVNGDRLRVSDPGEVVTPELVEELRAVKPEVMALVSRRPACVECGRIIAEEPTSWWGGDPVHPDCGERAWRRAWQAVPAERRGDGDSDKGKAA